MDSSIFWFVIYSIASARLTLFVSKENGPYDFMDYIRAKLGVRTEHRMIFDKHGKHVSELFRIGDNIVANAINCPLCLGASMAAIFLGLFFLRNNYVDIVALWLAMWGINSYYFKRDDLF